MNIYNSTRTIYNIKLQTCMMANIPYRPLPNTTLNEKLDILQYTQTECVNSDPNALSFPTIQGLIIGNGGRDTVTSDIGDLKLGKHSPVDGALFNQLPFVLRHEDNDLLEEDRAKYRLRKEMYIDGEKYFAYYLKMFGENDLEYRPEILYVDNNAAIPSIKIFSTDRSDILNPEPNNDTRMSTYENTIYTINLLRFILDMDDNELQELNNVFNLLNVEDTILTELGVVTGIDTVTDNGNELVYAQVAFFLDISLNLELIDDNLTKNIEIGGGEIIPIQRSLNPDE